jgi:hypothetical protein
MENLSNGEIITAVKEAIVENSIDKNKQDILEITNTFFEVVIANNLIVSDVPSKDDIFLV